MYFKLHKTPERCFLTICDKELIGKTFKENNLFLEIKEDFYKGSEKEIKSEVPSIILIGKKSIQYGLKNNLIEKSSIKKVENIPFVETIFL